MNNTGFRQFAACVCFAFLLTGRAAADAPKPALGDIDTLMIERDCTALSLDYGYALDANDPDALAALFAEDGVWDLRKSPPFMGRDAIRKQEAEIAQGRKPDEITRHVITNIRIEIVDKDHARGKAYMALYHYFAGQPPAKDVTSPSTVVMFQDAFVRTPQGWRFKSRTSLRVR